MDELTLSLLKDLYSTDYHFVDNQGNELNISPAGDINILAAGYKGLIALRKIRGWHLEQGNVIINLQNISEKTE